jgi:hypothetical protein
VRKTTITILSAVIFLCGAFICQNAFAADSKDKKQERVEKNGKVIKPRKPLPPITYKPMNLGMPGNRRGGSAR